MQVNALHKDFTQAIKLPFLKASNMPITESSQVSILQIYLALFRSGRRTSGQGWVHMPGSKQKYVEECSNIWYSCG